MGDIGQLFPSKDEQWKNADSFHFLVVTGEKLRLGKCEINHIDSVIILQRPKLTGFIPEMKYKISDTLQLDASQVSVKATTADYLGFIGDGRGLAVQTIATINA